MESRSQPASAHAKRTVATRWPHGRRTVARSRDLFFPLPLSQRTEPMAFMAMTAAANHIKGNQWDADRFKPRYESDSDTESDDGYFSDTDDTAVGAVTAQSAIPAEYFAQQPTAGSAASPASPVARQPASPVAAVGGAAAGGNQADPPVPPPELFAAQPIPESYGEWAEWSDVGLDLKADLGRQEARREAHHQRDLEKQTARQLGLRQADLKEYELAKAALIARGGAERLAERGGVEMGIEDANAFLWSHNIVAAENPVLEQKQHLLYMQTNGSNPYTNYREGAGQQTVFAMPTAGDSATLETGFADVVPQRALQQRVGVWVDPRTNLVSEVFEDLPPPAQGDWSTPPELRDSDRDNRKLVMLQGGWDPHNPPPPRREWEADQPLPESQNGDAAHTLPRRERQYQAIRVDIANNKGQMFDQAEIDRYPDGFVGYQNERAYASLIAPVPATLRGQPGTEWEMGDRETVGMSEWGPGKAVADAALGCAAAVSVGDRSSAIDRSIPMPVGLQEIRMNGKSAGARIQDRAPAPDPRGAQTQVTAKPVSGLSNPARTAENTRAPPVGHAVAQTGGAGGIPIGVSAKRDQPVGTDARQAVGPRGVIGATEGVAPDGARDAPLASDEISTQTGAPNARVHAAPAETRMDATRRPTTVNTARSAPADGAGLAAPVPSSKDATRRPEGVSSAFPTNISVARVPAARAGTTFDASGLSFEGPMGREAHGAASAAVVRGDAGLVVPGMVGQFKDPLRSDANAHRPSAGGGVVMAPAGWSEVAEAPRVGDAMPMSVPLPRSSVQAPRTSAAPLEEVARSARENPGVIGAATARGGVVAAAAINPHAEHVRSQAGTRMMPDRTVAAHEPRNRESHSGRLTPQRASRPERPSSRRNDRRDVFHAI